MTITVNGEPADFTGTVADLLEERRGDRRPHGIAVAVGEDIVSREEWDRYRLTGGEDVEIVTAVQGG